jgi:hypothetical protein
MRGCGMRCGRVRGRSTDALHPVRSARTARAREAGRHWAAAACAALTWAAVIATFRRVRRDHCDYALDKNVRPNSREIWDCPRGGPAPHRSARCRW